MMSIEKREEGDLGSEKGEYGRRRERGKEWKTLN